MEDMSELQDEILRQGPSPGTLVLLLGKMKAEGRFSEVLRHCRRALDIYPDDIRLRTLLAETCLETGFIGRAEAELDRVTQALDTLIPIYRQKAVLYMKQGRNPEAAALLTRYLAHFPDDREAADLLEAVRPDQEAPAEPPPPVEAAVSEAEPPLAEATPLEKEAEAAVPPETVEETPAVSPPAADEPMEPEGPPPEAFEEAGALADAPDEKAPAPGPAETPEPLPEADLVTEMATPTLAEIYYEQGQMEEALRAYEKVVRDRPDDADSARRLAEIRAELSGTVEPVPSPEDRARAGTERMIAVLEGWLSRLQEMGHA